MTPELKERMKRYYYTDVTAAMYMAKNFGMKFEIIAEEVDTKEVMHHQVIWEQMTVPYSGGFVPTIHPDSYELLKPKEGDLGLDATDSPSQYYQGSWEDIAGAAGGPNTGAELPIMIITRNNKPFIWPEEETI